MRLSTVSEMGDVVSVLSPAKSMLNSIRSEMCSILPEASQELGNIGNLLSDIVTTTNQGSDMPENTIMASADAMAILEEAEVAAEKRISEKFPEVDSGTVMNRRTRHRSVRIDYALGSEIVKKAGELSTHKRVVLPFLIIWIYATCSIPINMEVSFPRRKVKPDNNKPAIISSITFFFTSI